MSTSPDDFATWEHHCGRRSAPLGGYRRRDHIEARRLVMYLDQVAGAP